MAHSPGKLLGARKLSAAYTKDCLLPTTYSQAAVGLGVVPVQVGQKLETGIKLKE